MSRAIPTGHIPNIHHVELHLFYGCNLRCAHCSNNITEAPSNEMMDTSTIETFINDSVRLRWPWEWIVLHGGEPSLSPNLDEVCSLLFDYKRNHNHGCRTMICTNGFGDKVKAGLDVASVYGVEPQNSQKTGEKLVAVHRPLHVSPLDMGEDYYLGCFQSSSCGIAMNNHGFYECSPAAAGQRLFGYEPLATRLEDLTAAVLAKGFEKHCAHCGYARASEAADPSAPLSKTWLEASNAYKLKTL